MKKLMSALALVSRVYGAAEEEFVEKLEAGSKEIILEEKGDKVKTEIHSVKKKGW